MSDFAVPADFPRDPFPASLGGAQAKYSARRIGDRFVVGLTEEERLARYLMCQDLVEQLLAYCRRKATEHPEWSRESLLARVEKAVFAKQAEWELGGPEARVELWPGAARPWAESAPRACQGTAPKPSAHHARGHFAAPTVVLGHDVPARRDRRSLVLSVPDPGRV